MRASFPALLIFTCASCAAAPVVSAPSSYSPSAAPAAGAAAVQQPGADDTNVCVRPWNLDVIGGNGQVIVVCADDVRRQALGETAAVARALFTALDPARERVCSCVGRLRAPAFVDLVFTAKPEEGRATVHAGGDEDLDPVLGPPFVACIGTIAVTFAPLASEACAGGKASFLYPVRLELERDRPP